MPLRTDDAFVLARHPFRERDLVVVLLARSFGQVRVVARRARGLRSPFAAALEPLALARVSWFERPQRELGTLNDASLQLASFPLASDPLAWAAAQLVAELASQYCPPGQVAEASFRLVDHCVRALLERRPPLVVATYAEAWFLRLSGLLPDLDRCGACGAALAGNRWFDPAEGVLVCPTDRPARGGMRLSAAAVAWLERARRAPLDDIADAPPADARSWLAEVQRRFAERELASRRYLERLLEE